jgi:hypothetical protein
MYADIMQKNVTPRPLGLKPVHFPRRFITADSIPVLDLRTEERKEEQQKEKRIAKNKKDARALLTFLFLWIPTAGLVSFLGGKTTSRENGAGNN